jgi:uncharacterized protein (TIGR02453 family)
MTNQYFTSHTMTFLRKLAKNNNREWFEKNKSVYEDTVRTPALNFITDIADDLALLSPHFLAQAKKVGGSLMRVHRDVRFGADKRPYKTNIGIQFRHEQGKDVHAPGFYVHIEPGDCFVGVGIWRPNAVALGKVREVIAYQSHKWQAATSSKSFNRQFTLSGDSLSRPPRGYPNDHPLLDDLRRKDFIAIAHLSDTQVLDSRLKNRVLDRFKTANNFMLFLCNALELQY